MIHKGEKVVRIKDKTGMLQDWVIVDRIVNKYNPAIVTYEVELANNRGITTQIYVSKTYGTPFNTYYRESLSTGNGDNYGKAAFIGFSLSS